MEPLVAGAVTGGLQHSSRSITETVRRACSFSVRRGREPRGRWWRFGRRSGRRRASGDKVLPSRHITVRLAGSLAGYPDTPTLSPTECTVHLRHPAGRG